SMYENLIGFHEAKNNFRKFYGANNAKTTEKTVQLFKKNFKKETFYKLIRTLLVKNVHFGERNHNNDLTNKAVYTALGNYYKKEMDAIEAKYSEARSVREEKLKAKIVMLEGKLPVKG
ncbi:MAG: partitioning protein, partial [Maribacter sp.]